MEEMPKNTGAKIIKSLLKSKGMTIKELSKLLGYKSDNASQILTNKLYRDTLPLNEFVHIVNVLGCDVKTITKEGKTEYIVEYAEKKQKEAE